MPNENLINGLGGDAGYGEITLMRGDDNGQNFDFSSILGETIELDGSAISTTNVNIATNGFIDFETTRSGGFLNTTYSSNSSWIAPFASDLDTRLNSNIEGEGLVYVDMDADTDTVTVTWDQVGRFSANYNPPLSFQVQMQVDDGGSFVVTYRYGDMEINNPPYELVGHNLGVGRSETLFNTATSPRDFDTIVGNTGEAGVWSFRYTQPTYQFGTTGDDELVGTTGVDVMTGGLGDDTLRGLADDDQLRGGAGADWLIGGDGTDVAGYDFAREAVVVDLADTAQNTGWAAGDSYTTIEGIWGSGFSDTLRGDEGDNSLRGRSGADQMSGRGGNDTLEGDLGDDLLSGGDGSDRLLGGDGNDVLMGGAGDDLMTGGEGRDLFVGGAGADTMDGGTSNTRTLTEVDTVTYASETGAVRADLQFSEVNGLAAQGDTFVFIEDLIGTAFNDNLRGDFRENAITGGAGDDWIFGRAGNDSLHGGSGDDVLNGGYSDDNLRGGSGADTFVVLVDIGSDVIEDFELGIDTLMIGWHFGSEAESVASYLSDAIVRGGDLILGADHSFRTLTVQGVTDIEAFAEDVMLI